MDYIDLKYCGIVGLQLDRFTVKQNTPYKANFRCPFCGDSQKSKTKSRGWLYFQDNKTLFHCFNCQTHLTLSKFLEKFDQTTSNQYLVDKKLLAFEPDMTVATPAPAPKEISTHYALKGLTKVSSLPLTHPVSKYIRKRKIPSNKHYLLYFTKTFNAWVNSLIPDKLSVKKDEPRLVIPFFDERGKIIGFSGRSFDPKGLRYITIMLDETKPKIYGLDRVDFNKPYYVVEGPLDSLFLSNSIAMIGGSFNFSVLRKSENAIVVFDNEKRNKEIVNQVEKAIKAGLKVCLWPNSIEQKDINDMILAGRTTAEIELIINTNSYRGIEAELQLSFWRKS